MTLPEILRESLVKRRRPRVPEGLRLYWSWFVALSDARSHGFGVANPITFSDIEAFARLYRWPIEARHVDLIRAMDRVYLDHVNTAAASRPTPSVDITPQIFDAVFG